MPSLALPDRQAHAHVTVQREAPAGWGPIWESVPKDERYYEIIRDTLGAQFDCQYLVVGGNGSGEPRAVQPFFLVDQDLAMASAPSLRRIVGTLRRLAPRFMRLRVLMVGCAAGEGHLGSEDPEEQRSLARAIRDVLPRLARENRASMIVWKDFPSRYRECLTPLLNGAESAGYHRMPSMPATRLALDFTGYEDYMRRHLSRATRKSVRRKFRNSARRAPELAFEVRRDVSDIVPELHALYAQVLDRSRLRFEQLTPEFFGQLGRRMPDRARFFLWRHEGRLVAFNLCLVHGDTLYDEYIGLDYRVALSLHLYFVTLRDVFSWAMRERLRYYYSTPLNYDPKLHLGFELAPLDLYVRPTASGLRKLLRHAIPYIQPTRMEPLLDRFPNAHELYGPLPDGEDPHVERVEDVTGATDLLRDR